MGYIRNRWLLVTIYNSNLRYRYLIFNSALATGSGGCGFFNMTRVLEKTIATASFVVAVALSFISMAISADNDIASNVLFVVAQFLTLCATLLGIDYKFGSNGFGHNVSGKSAVVLLLLVPALTSCKSQKSVLSQSQELSQSAAATLASDVLVTFDWPRLSLPESLSSGAVNRGNLTHESLSPLSPLPTIRILTSANGRSEAKADTRQESASKSEPARFSFVSLWPILVLILCFCLYAKTVRR